MGRQVNREDWRAGIFQIPEMAKDDRDAQEGNVTEGEVTAMMNFNV